MRIYFVTFFLSSLLFALAEKVKASNKKIVVAVALLIPIMLAGLRKIGIGTDTEVYVNVLYDAASVSHSFFDYLGKSVYSSFQTKSVTNWEIGYNFLLYISTKLIGSYQGVLLSTHLVIIVLVYEGIKHFEGRLSVFWAMFAFYFMFYASSLNLMRQWIAIAIIFYGFHYLQINQEKKFFLTIIIAMLFHNSSIIGIIVWGIYKYFDKTNIRYTIVFRKKKLDTNVYKLLLLMIIGIIVLLGLSIIAQFLGRLSAVFARYVRLYISGTVQFMPMQIIRRLPIILLMIVNWRKLKLDSPSIPVLYGMTIMDLLTSQLGSITQQSGRMGYFFSIYEIILLAEFTKIQNRKKRMFYYIFIGIYLMLMFYYDNVLMGRSEIIPYQFFF